MPAYMMTSIHTANPIQIAGLCPVCRQYLQRTERRSIDLPKSGIGIHDRQPKGTLSDRPAQDTHGPDDKDDEGHDPLSK